MKRYDPIRYQVPYHDKNRRDQIGAELCLLKHCRADAAARHEQEEGEDEAKKKHPGGECESDCDCHCHCDYCCGWKGWAWALEHHLRCRMLVFGAVIDDGGGGGSCGCFYWCWLFMRGCCCFFFFLRFVYTAWVSSQVSTAVLNFCCCCRRSVLIFFFLFRAVCFSSTKAGSPSSLVAFYDAFTPTRSGYVAIVMEYCSGGSLQVCSM